MSNAKFRWSLRQRKRALCAVAGIAVVAVPALTTLPISATSMTSGSPIPVAVLPALKANMMRLAQYSGDAHPASINAVSTTQSEALRTATPGDIVPGSTHRHVYLVVMTGNFKMRYASVPSGARLPTGRYLAVTIKPSTFQVMDLSIGNHRPPVPLHSYGPVSDLIKQRG